jgi:hypothetical protein
MNPNEECLKEIVRGLEGLEMLSQWELSLTRDLRGKAEAALRSGQEKPPREPHPSDSA